MKEILEALHRECEAVQPNLQTVERLMRASCVRSIGVGDRCFERRTGLAGGVDVHQLPWRVYRDQRLNTWAAEAAHHYEGKA